MSWGLRGSPSVRLNYNALDTALHDQTKNKRLKIENQSRVDIYSRYNVQAYRLNAETIALKLYNTEIIHYHLGGLRTLYGEGWIETMATRHWFGEAGIWIEGVTPNVWSPRQYVLHSSQCLFYDSMQVDPDGVVVSGHRPVLIRKPNAEAKELRKRLTALGKIYRTFALMHAGSGQMFEVTHVNIDLTTIDPTIHQFDLEVYKQLVFKHQYYRHNPYYLVQQALADAYKQEVFRRNLFDITQGEEA